MRNYLILVSAALILLGCGTPYIEPSSGPIAYIDLKRSGPLNMFQYLWLDSKDCRQRRGLMYDRIKKEPAIIKIPATGDISWGLTHVETDKEKYCQMIITFSPQPDATYSFEYSSDEELCRVRLLKTVNGEFSIVDATDSEKIRQRNENFNWMEWEPGCKPESSSEKGT